MTDHLYNPKAIEKNVQKSWEDSACFKSTEDLSQPKFYCLSMMPYPSGEMHMGHVRNYTIGDVIARYQRMLGKNVMQPMAWDAFGLPAENAAIERKIAPAKWTRENIKTLKNQLKLLGFAIDWEREIATCDPGYYRWEQWLFIQLYKRGLVYKKSTKVNWDPVDQTVLANEQVVDGCGWRSGAPVEQKEIPQWFLKITDYTDELLQGLDTLNDWPERVKTMQRNWIGRSEGVDIYFPVAGEKDPLTIFTTRPDTLMGVNFVAISTEHPLALRAAEDDKRLAQFIKECEKGSVSEAEQAHLEKKGMPTKFRAFHPISNEEIPIWVTNYVLMSYGAGAIMAVSAHDERDFEFSQTYNIPFKPVIKPKNAWDFGTAAYTGEGTLINSGDFDGLTSKAAMKKIPAYLIKNKLGQKSVQSRLRDWGVSRQRYWGAPIPIIYCKDCGTLPVPEEDLPVILPENLIPEGKASPLQNTPEFYEVNCPSCGKKAKRETDTFDTFFESSWYYARLACPDQDTAILDGRANYWLPVDQYVGGIEHAVMHLLYARFFHKALRDLNILNSDEPFKRLLSQGMVLKDGAKMSKSKGNTVSPKQLISQYGADTVRLFSIFAAPPEQSMEWTDAGVEGAHRFLKRVFTLAKKHENVLLPYHQKKNGKVDWTSLNDEEKLDRQQLHQILQQASFDMERQQFNTVVSAAMKVVNLITQRKFSNIHLLCESISFLLRILNPIVPHISQHLWVTLGFGDNISQAPWPKVDFQALKTEHMSLVVQVNGKRRCELVVPAELDGREIEKLALKDEKIQRAIGDKGVKKAILVPKKLINIVTT